MKKLVFIIICVFTLIGCRAFTPPDPETPDPKRAELLSWQKETFAEDFLNFFDINTYVYVRIVITNDELNLLQADYDLYNSYGSKSPIYRMCDLEITIGEEITYIPEVGIRMRGNTSRRSFYHNNEFTALINFKFSFSETFDSDKLAVDGKTPYYKNPKVWDPVKREERKDRRFLGMEKMDSKFNLTQDTTHIKDYYSSKVLESAGLLVQKETIAGMGVSVDGKNDNLGVYTIYEAVDEHFLAKRLEPEELGGDLYKVSWGGNMTLGMLNRIGIDNEDESKFYTYDLKTNKKTSDFSVLKDFITKLNTPREEFDTLIDTLIDIEYFLKFEAMSYYCGSPDDLKNFANNHYLYFLNKTKKMVVIAYDNDRTFGMTSGWNPTGDGVTTLNPYSLDMGGDRSYVQQNPLYLNTILWGGNPEYIIGYRNWLLTYYESPLLTPEAFASVFEIAKANHEANTKSTLASLQYRGLSFNNDPQPLVDTTYLNIDFETYITLKKQTLMKWIYFTKT